MHITILGKRWKLRFVPRKELSRNTCGECDDPTVTGKEIRIRSGMNELDELDTIIHEALHAADWHKNEDWVNQVGTDIARALWRLGYRRQSS